MLRMIGRLVWMAVGAVGVKAWEESQRQKRTTGGHGSRGGARKRSGGTDGNGGE